MKNLTSWHLLLAGIGCYILFFLIGQNTVETKLIGAIIGIVGFGCLLAFIASSIQKIINFIKRKRNSPARMLFKESFNVL